MINRIAFPSRGSGKGGVGGEIMDEYHSLFSKIGEILYVHTVLVTNRIIISASWISTLPSLNHVCTIDRKVADRGDFSYILGTIHTPGFKVSNDDDDVDDDNFLLET